MLIRFAYLVRRRQQIQSHAFLCGNRFESAHASSSVIDLPLGLPCSSDAQRQSASGGVIAMHVPLIPRSNLRQTKQENPVGLVGAPGWPQR